MKNDQSKKKKQLNMKPFGKPIEKKQLKKKLKEKRITKKKKTIEKKNY